MCLVSVIPSRGHASFQFDDGWAGDEEEGTSWGDHASVQLIYSVLSWPAPSNLVMPAPREPYLLKCTGGGALQMFTDPSDFRGFRIDTTTSTAAALVFHGSVGLWRGSVSDNRIVSNLPSSLLSEAALSPHKPHAFERLPHTGGGNLAIAPGPLAEENPDGGVTEGYQGHGHTIACGWIKPNGILFSEPIDYHCEGHFTTAHGVTNMSPDVTVDCSCGCPKRGEAKTFHPPYKGSAYEVPAHKDKRGPHVTLERKKTTKLILIFSDGMEFLQRDACTTEY